MIDYRKVGTTRREARSAGTPVVSDSDEETRGSEHSITAGLSAVDEQCQIGGNGVGRYWR